MKVKMAMVWGGWSVLLFPAAVMAVAGWVVGVNGIFHEQSTATEIGLLLASVVVLVCAYMNGVVWSCRGRGWALGSGFGGFAYSVVYSSAWYSYLWVVGTRGGLGGGGSPWEAVLLFPGVIYIFLAPVVNGNVWGDLE